MKNTNIVHNHLQRQFAEIRQIVSKNAKIINAMNAIIRRILGPSNRPITKRMLRDFKTKAKALSKKDLSLTFCQHLEVVTRESTSLSSYNEALELVKKHNPNAPLSPMGRLNKDQFVRCCNHVQMVLGGIALNTLTVSDIDDDLWSLMQGE